MNRTGPPPRHRALDQQGRRQALPVEQVSRAIRPRPRARSCSCTAPRWPRSRPSISTCPGRPDSSAMEYFAKQGYDCWCVDMEGYGRSTKDRDNNAPISFGADDCYAAATYIQKLRGPPPAPRLRHLVRRAARRAVRRAPSRDGRPARARRHGVDRRRLADACRAAQEAARVPVEEPPADRPRLRAFDLQPRPSGHAPRTA